MRSRWFLFLAVSLACARAPDERGVEAEALSGPLAARLTGIHVVAVGDSLEPRLSADGLFVAFTSLQYRGLRVAPASGGSPRVVSDAPGAGYRPAWSPDASRIAFQTVEADGTRALWEAQRDSGPARNVWRGKAGAPWPMPRYAASGELVFLDGDRLRAGGRDQPITPPLPSPRLTGALGRSTLVIAGDQGMFLAESDGSRPRALFPGRRFFEFATAPDGSTLLARELGEKGAGLWSIDVGTARSIPLDGFDRACVLPSGHVVAERLESDGLRLVKGELWLMRPDGSGATVGNSWGTVVYSADTYEYHYESGQVPTSCFRVTTTSFPLLTQRTYRKSRDPTGRMACDRRGFCHCAHLLRVLWWTIDRRHA